MLKLYRWQIYGRLSMIQAAAGAAAETSDRTSIDKQIKKQRAAERVCR